MEKKEWKKIEGFERYWVSCDGQVASSRLNKNKTIILKPALGGSYLRVVLRKENKSYGKFLHRLVANAFVEKIKGKDYVNHKDGNKLNNRSENLEWVDRFENMDHYFNSGIFNKRKKTTPEKVKLIREMHGWEGNTTSNGKNKAFSYYWIARCFKLKLPTVQKIINRTTWKEI